MNRILLHADHGEDAFAAALAAALPERRILRTPPEDGAPTPYLVVGRPPKGLIRTLTGVRLILSLNAGVDALMEGGEAPPEALVVKMADEGLRRGMVEYVLAHVLAWHRNLWAYASDQAEGAWRPRTEKIANERRACVLGAGALGGAAAAALADLGFATRVWSRSGTAARGATAFAGLDALSDAVDGADILVCLLPKTPATTDLLRAEHFARLAEGALFLNAGRGAVVVDHDLLGGLAAGRPGLAVLDVFREEPLPGDHPYWTHPRVRLSPHVAAETRPDTAAAAVADTILRFERGEPLSALAEPGRGY